jgi:hypothetical protein
MRRRTTNKSVIPEKLLHPTNNQHLSKWSSLVKIPPQSIEVENKEYGPKGIRTLDPRHVKAVS